MLRRLLILALIIGHLGYAAAVLAETHGLVGEHDPAHVLAHTEGDLPDHPGSCDHGCHAASHLIALPSLYAPSPIGPQGIGPSAPPDPFRSKRFPPPTRPPKHLA